MRKRRNGARGTSAPGTCARRSRGVRGTPNGARGTLTRGTRGTRAAAVVAVLAAGLGACGGGDDSEPVPEATRTGPDQRTAALIDKANKAMSGTGFTASGTSTAFEGAEQDLRWDPEEGLRMEVRADDGTEGTMYCKEGASYISAPLLAHTLEQRGQSVTVPKELSGVYVTVQATGQGCEAYFKIPESGLRAPDKDGAVGGEKTRAISVRNGGTADVYHVAATGEPRLLKMESERDGRRSTTTYRGFGKDYPLTLPPEEQRMEMSEFQRRVSGAG